MTDTSPGIFTAALALLAAAADVPGTKARLAELAKQIAAAERALTKLAADTAEHERKTAAETAAMDEREQELRQRHVAVSIAERAVDERAQRYADALPPRYPHDPNIFGTLTREPEHG